MALSWFSSMTWRGRSPSEDVVYAHSQVHFLTGLNNNVWFTWYPTKNLKLQIGEIFCRDILVSMSLCTFRHPLCIFPLSGKHWNSAEFAGMPHLFFPCTWKRWKLHFACVDMSEEYLVPQNEADNHSNHKYWRRGSDEFNDLVKLLLLGGGAKKKKKQTTHTHWIY